MAAVDRRVAGHFAERSPPQPLGSLFGFDIEVLELPAADGGACARQRSKIATASDAIVEVLGKHAFVGGDGDERRRARAMVTQLVPHAGPFGDAAEIPEELEECCSMVRVPTAAVSTVAGVSRVGLSKLEEAWGCLAFWLPLGTSVRPRGKAAGGVSVGGTTVHDVGTKVLAQYDGSFHGAVVVGAGKVKGKVRIAWDFDGSEEEVLALELQLSNASKKREQWLQKLRVLAIVGPERARRAFALQVMEASEGACPGLWTTGLADAVSELQDGRAEDEVLFGAAAFPHEGSAQELEWLRGPQGQQAMRGAAGAAPCLIQLIGRVLFFVGYSDQRERGREYLRWATLSRHRAGGPAGARAGGSLGVFDADMRDDLTVVLLREAVAVWLRSERLHAIERETETLLVFDDGGGCALEEGTRRLLICGASEAQRSQAQLKAEALGRGAPQVARAPEAAVRREELPVPEAKRPRDARVDPREVLKTIPWPATINAWGLLQKTVWAGHPRLSAGWIRVWSRSQDCEYYLRLKDMKSTFDLNEVIER